MADIREIFAGTSHTTSANASRMIYLLAKYKPVQNKLFNLLKENPTEFNTYFNYCFLEASRILPLTRYSNRTAVSDTKIGSHFVPENSKILVCFNVHGLNEKYFENPLEFTPERWINSTPLMRKVNLVFGDGPRNCVGQNWGQKMVKAFVEILILNFEFDFDGEIDVKKEYKNIYSVPKTIKINPRKL